MRQTMRSTSSHAELNVQLYHWPGMTIIINRRFGGG
jgi:hypothetical protein